MGNQHRGYRSPCAFIDELLILEQVNQWLGVLGTHIEWTLWCTGGLGDGGVGFLGTC